MLYFIKARKDRLIWCDNIYYRSIFICHSITFYCTSCYMHFSPLLFCLIGFSKIPVHQTFVKMNSHIAPGKKEMRGRCFCMLVGGMGKKLGKQLLQPIYYSYIPFNHLPATHRFTRNALNPLNLWNDALLKSQQGSQLSLSDTKDLL